VTDREFLFAVTVSDHPGFESMLTGLAVRVLEDAGYTSADAAQIIDTLRGTFEEAAEQGGRGCDVQFRAEGGRLNIVASYGRGREWRMTRPLPD
jgi:hypothetical protein